MKVIYVETCPECDCALARLPEGDVAPSPRLEATCSGCACHNSFPIAAGS